MKNPAYLLDKFYLDNASDVRQAGHMMLSFIFAFEDNCEVIFLNKGFLNLIDFTNTNKLIKLKEKYQYVYNYIIGKHISEDLSSKEHTLLLIEKCKTLYTQWSLFTNEYESDNPIHIWVVKEYHESKILKEILDLILDKKIDLFGDIEFNFSLISQVELKERLENYKWVYKA